MHQKIVFTMEELLHYVWKHKIFPLHAMTTVDGRLVEVIDPGLHNHGSGPDFFNAKVRIGGQLWIGNVEIHVRASDWFRHHHHIDQAYKNVVLHVVAQSDADIPLPGSSSQLIPQMVLSIPDNVRHNYSSLSTNDFYPRCRDVVRTSPHLTIHSWLSALQVERLEDRSISIKERWERLNRNWDDTLFVTIARNFGFGKNGDAFERWACSFSLISIGKHRDSLLQVEAMFFGQAGLLEEERPELDDYYSRLRSEYNFLRHKFGLSPISPSLWTWKVRPENFPEIRLAQLAHLYHSGGLSLSRLLNASDLDQISNLFSTCASGYWRTHYNFKGNKSSMAADKALSKSSLDLVVINSVVPFLFTYGRYKGEDSLCDRAFDLMESMKPEKNSYITKWESAGVTCHSAADSQALMQLSKNYCEKHNCLRCRFGYEYIKRTPNFLAEDEGK